MASNWKDYRPELWGGIECSCIRVNDKFRDQLYDTGHYTRSGDIELIAGLGISKIRYPILWERHQPDPLCSIDWTWTAKQLKSFHDHRIDVIAGLLHHGSGPLFTSLADENFPELFAAYARKVATQFPYIQYYNPINEPLTTARFSGLYGFWYPHHKNEMSFFRMLLNQLKAIVLGMSEIKQINPDARLIQSEDLTVIHSSPLLAYQAAFENERRWLTYDLLCGKVDRSHYFWKYLLNMGIPESSLHFFIENPCPPDCIGFNYYVTSERFLDENFHQYPAEICGGNGRHIYADTEAVRAGKMKGLSFLLQEAWKRYGIPLAITECYLQCTRDEQLRWIKYCWDTVCKLNHRGIPVKALTIWSLFGSYDWNSLLREHNNIYETGAFDIRSEKPRRTAIGNMTAALAEKKKYDHPLLQTQGWWLRKPDNKKKTIAKQPMLLIIGKHGTLAYAFSKICADRSIPHRAFSKQDLNILNEKEIWQAINQFKPWAIINTAGFVDVDLAESKREECFALNMEAPAKLAEICQSAGIRLMHFSSDLVFSGDKKLPYDEEDRVGPINIYGTSKAQAERLVLTVNPSALIIRSSAFFGPWDRANFAYKTIESVTNGLMFGAADDVLISPTYVPDLVHTALDLFIDEEKGIWHIANEGNLSWAAFGGVIAERAGYSKKNITLLTATDMGWIAKRPAFSVIKSRRGIQLPHLEQAIDRYFNERVV